MSHEEPDTAPDVRDSNDDTELDGWGELGKAMREEEEELLKKWEKELGNLLTFAGLFSATVTSFTVESYKWLQDDPAETSAKILKHMSAQFASFATTQGFMNSTLPPYDVTATDSESVPNSALAVKINMLWLLSLALSLIASFYIIVVQQWLRFYVLPSRVRTMQAIRVRQYRSEALQNWRVPFILSLLPTLIQIAVVLFFAGLFLLLQPLNTAIALVFGLVSVIPLAVFGFSIIFPLIWSTCPYRSPILPMAWSLAHVVLRPFLSLLQHLVDRLDSWPVQLIPEPQDQDLDGPNRRIIARLFNWTIDKLYNWETWEFRHFWTNRDTDAVGYRSSRADKSHRRPYELFALARVYQLLPPEKLRPVLSQCVPGDAWAWRTYVAVRVVMQALGNFTYGDCSEYSVDHYVNPRLLERIEPDFSHRLGEFLLSVIDATTPSEPVDWAPEAPVDWIYENGEITSILIVLDKAATVEEEDRGRSDVREPLAHHLLRLCCGTKTKTFRYKTEGPYLPVLLHRYCLPNALVFELSERQSFWEWTMGILHDYIDADEGQWRDSAHGVLAALTCALRMFDPLVQYSGEELSIIVELVENTTTFIEQRKKDICKAIVDCSRCSSATSDTIQAIAQAVAGIEDTCKTLARRRELQEAVGWLGMAVEQLRAVQDYDTTIIREHLKGSTAVTRVYGPLPRPLTLARAT